MPARARQPQPHPHSPHPAPPPGPGRLAALAQVLARAGRDGHVALVGVEPCGADEADLHLRAVPGDLFDAILGWRPPASWWAVGVLAPVAAVVAVPVSAPGEAGAPAPAGAAGPTGTALLVGRDGSVTVGLADGDGARGREGPPGAVEGRLEELCRLALALPTPPCPVAPGRLWAAAWLDAITGLAADRPASALPLRWPALAALHPLRSALARADVPGPAQLARLADHPVARAGWAALREATATGHLSFPDTTPALAGWFDDGSFGRWLVGRYPPPEQLLAALADLLAPGDHDDLCRVVAAWGVGTGPIEHDFGGVRAAP